MMTLLFLSAFDSDPYSKKYTIISGFLLKAVVIFRTAIPDTVEGYQQEISSGDPNNSFYW